MVFRMEIVSISWLSGKGLHFGSGALARSKGATHCPRLTVGGGFLAREYMVDLIR
jgi:hypothetical protein